MWHIAPFITQPANHATLFQINQYSMEFTWIVRRIKYKSEIRKAFSNQLCKSSITCIIKKIMFVPNSKPKRLISLIFAIRPAALKTVNGFGG